MKEIDYMVEVKYGYCHLASFLIPDEDGNLQDAYISREFDEHGRLVREDKGSIGIKLILK